MAGPHMFNLVNLLHILTILNILLGDVGHKEFSTVKADLSFLPYVFLVCLLLTLQLKVAKYQKVLLFSSHLQRNTIRAPL